MACATEITPYRVLIRPSAINGPTALYSPRLLAERCERLTGSALRLRIGRNSIAPAGGGHTPAYAAQCDSVGVDARQCSCSSVAQVRRRRCLTLALPGEQAWTYSTVRSWMPIPTSQRAFPWIQSMS
jgi:hypothetical protein